MFNDLLNYAKRHPEIMCYAYLDNFRVAVNTDNLSTLNIPRTYATYKKGWFWSRDFELAGSRRDKMRKAYPLLVAESKRFTPADRFQVNECKDPFALDGFTGRIEKSHNVGISIIVNQECYDVAIEETYKMMDELVYFLDTFGTEGMEMTWTREGEIYQSFLGVDRLFSLSVMYKAKECKNVAVIWRPEIEAVPLGIVERCE